MTSSNALQLVAMLWLVLSSSSWRLTHRRPSTRSSPCMSQPQSQPETTHHDSALEVVAFDSINNFRRALPGTSLPIYRCAALDRASPSDANRLDPLTTIIDLRNTEEIVRGYEKRSFQGGVALYSAFKVVLDSMKSVELMRSGVGKRYYGRSFEAIIGDLYYPRMFASSSGRGSGSGSGSGSSSGSGSRVSGSVSGSNFGTRKTIYQLPLFGDSADFWEAINDLTTISAAPTATGTSCSNSGSSASESDRDSNSGNDSGSDSGSASGEMGATKSVWGVGERLLSTLTTLQDAIDPLKKRARLERLLEEGGLPLLYEAMLEVSAKRVAGAMFVVLLVCEEYCSGLEAGNGKGKGNGSGDTDDKIAAGGSGIERPNDHTSDSGSVVAGSTGAAVESGAVVFHCAQGKDRTGLLAVLLTVALYGDSKETEARMVREYAASERLLPAKEAEAGAGAGAGTEVNEAVQMVSTSSSSSSASATASPSASASATQFDRDSAVVRRVFLASQTTSASASAASASATATVATATPADEDPSTTSPATTGPQPTATTSTTTTSSPRPPNQRLLNLSEVSSLQGSPPHAIVGLLARIRRRYGSVEGYLDKIGFTEEYRRRLRGCAEVATRANKGKEV